MCPDIKKSTQLLNFRFLARRADPCVTKTMRFLGPFLSSLVASPRAPKKTLLDTGPMFTNHTYFRNDDITVVSQHPSTISKTCAVVLPGVDMSGLSVYPHVKALSRNMQTYTFVSGDRHDIDLDDMVRCVYEFIDASLQGFEVTLIGESSGAIVAINSLKRLHDTRASKIKRLVLLNPANGFWDIPDPEGATRNIVDTLAVMKHSPSFMDISRSIDGLMTMFPDAKMNHIKSYFYMLYNEFMLPGIGKRYRVSNWIGSSRDTTMECIRDHMKDVETVLILGENDGVIPQEPGLRVFQRHVRNLVVHWVPGGTHLLTPNLVDVSKWV